jgi:hypothetical protein
MSLEPIQIQEILNGYIVDRKNIQSVGNMTVIPIISEVEFTNVADVNDVTLKKDHHYNRLEFSNASGNIGIVMQGWTIMTEQAAQDRTLPYAHLIKAANSKLIPANCIQSRQGGLHNVAAFEQENFMILPPSLRSIAFKKSTIREAETGALWESLHTWVNGIDCKADGLKHFYSKFESKLNEFVAQFEPVDNQLGAIVLINNEVISIDIVPKYDTWKKMWKTIIRDSYGSEALRIIENEGANIDTPSIQTSKIKSFADLKTNYKKMKSDFYDDLQGKFGKIAQTNIGQQLLEKVDELTNIKFECTDFIGQGIMHGNSHFIYVSLVRSNMIGKKTEKMKSLRNDPYSNSTFFFRGVDVD